MAAKSTSGLQSKFSRLIQERDILQQRLKQAGTGTMIHYPVPPHLQPAYAETGLAEGAFPISESIYREVLSLPMGTHI